MFVGGILMYFFKILREVKWEVSKSFYWSHKTNNSPITYNPLKESSTL